MTVQYRVEAKNRAEFIAALDELRHQRKRDGAFAWGTFEDTLDGERFTETFMIESWLELRHALGNQCRSYARRANSPVAKEPAEGHIYDRHPAPPSIVES